MNIRVIIGDKAGNQLGEVDALVGPVVWHLNDAGKTTLALSRSSEFFNEDFINPGNRVYLEFDNGLPPWGGLIDLNIGWTRNGVSFDCYEIPQVLKSRITDKNVNFREVQAGTILRTILIREEQQDPIGLVMGSVWSGGDTHWISFHYTSVWDVIFNSVRDMERCDIYFKPYIDSEGLIKFRVVMDQIGGSNKTNEVQLIEDRNVGGTELLV